MLLTVDIGNTTVTFGVFDGDTLKLHGKISSRKRYVPVEYGIIFKDAFDKGGAKPSGIKGVVISSVVPGLEDIIKGALTGHLLPKGVKPLVAGADIPYGMPLDVDNPSEVGADRVVNAVAAYERFKTSVIVVDFGTAVTLDYVTPDGRYAGGVIAPGISISSDALHEKTAKLPKVGALRPGNVIGKNTVDAVRSGLYWGFAGLVDGVLEKMIAEIKALPEIIATGGDAALIAVVSGFIKEIDEFLTLKGLKILYERKR
ncbi:MAG: type III pantothenate kinase [Deltaproteobacteria bacterium]|nr:type III pantothenate kinase [Deltaproteobacteria bacterium]